MIKNLLYSLFLHFLLLLVIYANFNLKKFDENKSSEIAVSLIALNGDENSTEVSLNSSKEKESTSVLQKNLTKQPQSQNKSVKNKVKEQPKKLTKSKSVKSVEKLKAEEKIQEFKAEEKPEEKLEEANKPKDDSKKSDGLEEEDNNIQRQKKDFGSKQIFNHEQEESEQSNSDKNNADMTNSLDGIDLSVREKFNIQSQLKRCYRMAIDEAKLSSKAKVLIKVGISKDGYIESDLDELIDIERYNNPKEPDYKIAIDNIERAIDLCSPLRNLPLEKYDVWKEVILEFDDEKQNQKN